MKKLFTCLAVVLFGAAMWSCSPYDDEELREAVDDLNDRVEAMEEAVRNANSGIETLRKLVEALQKNMTVTSVIKTENGYTINFSDGTPATITNGTNAPSISVIKDEDGLYYWALDGRIIEIDGRKIKAEGSDGITPQLRINSDTKEWEMSLDGTTWTPMGVTAEGQDGDSLFSKVEDGDTEVVFTLSDGKTTIVIPKTSTAGFAFVFPETLPRGGTNVDNYYLFAFGEERELPFTGDVATVDLMHVPQGWSAKLDPHAKTVTVTAPASGSSYYTEGILSLIAIDRAERTTLASARIAAVDYSDPEGTFVLNEGNPSSDNGSVIYITSDGRLINYAYWRMNGTELGNAAQDLFIADDKLYIVSQNGGNDGMLVEADARTLKRTDNFSKDDCSSLSWPSHVAVVGRTAYIRDNAGVWTLDLDSRSLKQIEGTAGALKNRMAVVGDKVFVPANSKVLILENGNIAETIAMEGTVTGVIKSDEEGYVWVSCSTSPAQIIKLSATDYTMEKHTLTEGGVSAGWGATPAISAKGDEIYFCNNTSTIYRHTFSTNTTETLGDVKPNVVNWGIIYNMPAVHPVTGEYYYNTILGYGWSFLTNDISVYDLNSDTPAMVADYQNYTHFPAGIYFTAGF